MSPRAQFIGQADTPRIGGFYILARKACLWSSLSQKSRPIHDGLHVIDFDQALTRSSKFAVYVLCAFSMAMPWHATSKHSQRNSIHKQGNLGEDFDALKDIPPMPTRPPPKIVTFDLDAYNFWPLTTTRSNESRKIKNKPLEKICQESQSSQVDHPIEIRAKTGTKAWDCMDEAVASTTDAVTRKIMKGSISYQRCRNAIRAVIDWILFSCHVVIKKHV